VCAGYICIIIIIIMYAGYMRENKVSAWNYRRALQQCWLLRPVNKRQDYWYRQYDKYRPIPIPTDTGQYQPIPDTGVGLTLPVTDPTLVILHFVNDSTWVNSRVITTLAPGWTGPADCKPHHQHHWWSSVSIKPVKL